LSSGKRREMRGVVVSDKMDKTVAVAVTRTFRHPLYKRVVKLTRTYLAHNEGVAKEGDHVRIEETRPMSKRKRWRVLQVLATTG
jgi:small subunit ribosomal protein S17